MIALILIANYACEKKVDVEKEKEAIKVVIENESNSYLARDFAKQSESFLQDESLIFLGASADDYWFSAGWEDISIAYQNIYKDQPDSYEGHFTYENYKIKVYEESAFVQYDEIAYDAEGKFMRKNISVRFLEKIKGEWKIVYLGFVNATSYED